MKNTSVFIFLSFAILVSCKSDFEIVRTSGNAAKILEKADEYYEAEDYNKAITLYELIIPSYRGKAEAETIAYNYASAHYKNRSYILASHYYQNFSETYNTSQYREEALYLKALSHYKTSPKFKLDQTDSSAAIDAFQYYANAYPESERIEECNRYIDELRKKLEKKEFQSGMLYYNTRDYQSAIQTFENMLKDFPDSELIEEARFFIAKSSVDFARNSIFSRQEERFSETVEHCEAFLKKHPESDRVNEILEFKEISERELNQINNG